MNNTLKYIMIGAVVGLIIYFLFFRNKPVYIGKTLNALNTGDLNELTATEMAVIRKLDKCKRDYSKVVVDNLYACGLTQNDLNILVNAINRVNEKSYAISDLNMILA